MIKDTVKHATPSEICEKLIYLENSIDFPRNLQQCRIFRKKTEMTGINKRAMMALNRSPEFKSSNPKPSFLVREATI